MSTLTNFLLEPGCEDYSLTKQLQPLNMILDFILINSVKTLELKASFDEPDTMSSSVSSGFLHLVSAISDNSKLWLAPSITFHELWC